MTALAAVVGALLAGGLVILAYVVNNHHGTARRLSTRLWTTSVNRLGRRRLIELLAGAGIGLVIAAFTGWWLLAILLPGAGLALRILLSAPPNRELELLLAIDRWLRTLGSLILTGRSISDAIRISIGQAPSLLIPSLRMLVARIDDRWTIDQALTAMAEEFDSPDADAVLAALSLAAQRGGTGAGVTIAALADNLSDRIKALREIDTERAKPRFVVRQVTLITVVVLGLAIAFSGEFFTPFASPTGQLVLAILTASYFGSLIFLRQLTVPRTRHRILGTAP